MCVPIDLHNSELWSEKWAAVNKDITPIQSVQHERLSAQPQPEDYINPITTKAQGTL